MMKTRAYDRIPSASTANRRGVLLTGLAALVFFPILAVCWAADAAVRKF